MFNGVKSKLINGSSGDPALAKEQEALRVKLHDRFKYATLFKDAAQLERDQEDKRKRKQADQLLSQQNSEENGATSNSGEVATMLDEMTLCGSGTPATVSSSGKDEN